MGRKGPPAYGRRGRSWGVTLCVPSISESLSISSMSTQPLGPPASGPHSATCWVLSTRPNRDQDPPSACLPCLCLLPCSACGWLSWCLFSVPSWSSRLNRGGLPFLKSFCPIFLHPGRHPGLPVSPPLCTGLALVFGPWSTAYGHIY